MSDYVTDVQRLTEVGEFDVFSPAANAVLDGFARRAADHFGMPIGLVSIVLDGAQYLAGSHGVDGWIAEAQGTPVEWSFCAQVVRSRQRYVVEDAARDDRQRDNPLVAMLGPISYAGAPLITTRGHVLGSYCVLGAPRTFTAGELDELQRLADDVMAELERHHRIPAGAATGILDGATY